MADLALPLTATGRKYGYIMWSKNHEPDLRALVGPEDYVTLVLPSGMEKRQHVDWKHRRISLSYSFTRALPEAIQTIHLKGAAPGRFEVSFH